MRDEGLEDLRVGGALDVIMARTPLMPIAANHRDGAAVARRIALDAVASKAA